jgi:exodeoxyribonuclease V alpha subunit
MSTYYSGRVTAVIHENVPQAFYVFKVVLDTDGDKTSVHSLQGQTTVRGYVPGFPLKTGAWLGFEGNWKSHPRFGRQLEITKAPVIKDWDADTIQKILVANGVGEMLVRSVREHFGKDFPDAVQDEKLLLQMNGITLFSAKHIVAKWEFARANFKTVEFLNDLGVPRSKIKQIWAKFGDDAEQVLAKDPWQLVAIDGFSFSDVDSVAANLGLELGNNPLRIRGIVLHGCRSQKSMGHLYVTTALILGYVHRYIPEATDQEVAEALIHLHKNEKLRIDAKTVPGKKAVYEPWFYRVESESAKLLKDRVETATGGDQAEFLTRLANVGPKTEKQTESGDMKKSVEAAIAEWDSLCGIGLSKKQRAGIFNALTAPVSVVTGLPGTGKTTSLRVLIKILQTIGTPFLLAAPTGIAAKRLALATGAKAYTIHRAFAAKLDEKTTSREATYEGVVGESQLVVGTDDGEWGYSEDDPYPAQFIILDEASMIDQSLLYRLLFCTANTSKLVFVGDAAQLPSVGPGNVLRDIISSGHFPVTKLTEIFRQEDTSDIILAAHDIHNGLVPKTPVKSDFSFVSVRTEEEALEAILKLAVRLQGARREFQILSPRHAGAVGVTTLNRELRQVLNPAKVGLTEVKLGSGMIRQGDRIMVVKNNYRLGVYNGDIGRVLRIDLKAKEIEVEIEGVPPLVVRFSFQDAAAYIRLAYACSIHKSQGQEYDTVLMPLVPSFKHQLQRNLLYTAITRAKEKVILIGSKTAMETAINNNREDERNTLFVDRLIANFSLSNSS